MNGSTHCQFLVLLYPLEGKNDKNTGKGKDDGVGTSSHLARKPAKKVENKSRKKIGATRLLKANQDEAFRDRDGTLRVIGNR